MHCDFKLECLLNEPRRLRSGFAINVPKFSKLLLFSSGVCWRCELLTNLIQCLQTLRNLVFFLWWLRRVPMVVFKVQQHFYLVRGKNTRGKNEGNVMKDNLSILLSFVLHVWVVMTLRLFVNSGFWGGGVCNRHALVKSKQKNFNIDSNI